MASSSKTFYILYNADSTIFGKLQYACRKIQRPSTSQPACAACDITHGGFSLNENDEWKAAKAEIEQDTGATIKQLHKDEVEKGMKAWIESNGIKYPAVVLGKKSGDGAGEESLLQVLTREDLASFHGNAKALAQALKENDLVADKQASL